MKRLAKINVFLEEPNKEFTAKIYNNQEIMKQYYAIKNEEQQREFMLKKKRPIMRKYIE